MDVSGCLLAPGDLGQFEFEGRDKHGVQYSRYDRCRQCLPAVNEHLGVIFFNLNHYSDYAEKTFFCWFRHLIESPVQRDGDPVGGTRKSRISASFIGQKLFSNQDNSSRTKPFLKVRMDTFVKLSEYLKDLFRDLYTSISSIR